MIDSLDIQKLALQLPKVEPCWLCGLPITREQTKAYEVIVGSELVWQCLNSDNCVEQLNRSVKNHGGYYADVLRSDPLYPWEYKFTCHIKASWPDDTPVTYNTELTIYGLWNIHSFPQIVRDALIFAQDHEAMTIRITNEADDILWEDS